MVGIKHNDVTQLHIMC